MRAPISEIFCSVQGEGPYVGARQVFLRFGGCNLSCSYCDTPGTRAASKSCRVEVTPGKGDFSSLRNPLEAEKVLETIRGYGKIHSVALTGGEPLLYADFIRGLDLDAPLYLETNMSLPEEAVKLRNRVSYVAGDFKLKDAFSDSMDSREVREMSIRSFKVLRATRKRDCFCKVVVQSSSAMDEVLDTVEQVKGYISSVILQPVSGDERVRASPADLLRLQQRLMDVVEAVRVIPQTHKIWGAL